MQTYLVLVLVVGLIVLVSLHRDVETRRSSVVRLWHGALGLVGTVAGLGAGAVLHVVFGIALLPLVVPLLLLGGASWLARHVFVGAWLPMATGPLDH